MKTNNIKHDESIALIRSQLSSVDSLIRVSILMTIN